MLADAIVKEMLQAQIEIVDEAGRTEESMTILGSGRVSLGARQTGGYLHADEAATDLAVITQEDARVSINVKMANALERDRAFITPGSGSPCIHARRNGRVQRASAPLRQGEADLRERPPIERRCRHLLRALVVGSSCASLCLARCDQSHEGAPRAA